MTMTEEEAKQRERETTTLPAGYGLILPGTGAPGFILPNLKLTFDPPPASVIEALRKHEQPTVTWPITGKIAHIRSISLPCKLDWSVRSGADKDGPVTVTSAHPSKKTIEDGRVTFRKRVATLDVDGAGGFRVRVDGADPVLCLVAAQVRSSGTVGYNLFLSDFPNAKVMQLDENRRIPFAGITTQASVVVSEQARLGDPAVIKATLPPPFDKVPLRIEVAEVDDEDTTGTRSRTVAFRAELTPRRTLERTWKIGFQDEHCNRFYTENEESGDFEYVVQLQAKSALTEELHELWTRDRPFKVAKPVLTEFNLDGPETDGLTYRTHGTIANLGKHLNLTVKVQAVVPVPANTPAEPAAATYTLVPSGEARVLPVGFDRNGNGHFSGSLRATHKPPAAPVDPAALPWSRGLADPTSARPFAMLTLPLHERGEGNKREPGPIAAFLGFNESVYARLDPIKGLTWDPAAAWVCSQEWRDSGGVRPEKPKNEYGDFPAPPADAGGDQGSVLTMDEIVADLKGHEGVVGHMYKDSEGLVTAGIGTRLTTGKGKAQTIKAEVFDWFWVDASSGQSDVKVDRAAIQNAYDRVMKKAANLGAKNYWQRPSIELPLAEMERLVRGFATQCLNDARTKAFRDKFDAYPKCVRRLIVDIMYNAGQGALIPGSAGFWPSLHRCLDQRNWKDAVRHVEPKKGQRAAWRRSLLEYAQKL